MIIKPHIAKSVECVLKNLVDTDVCVLLLHYTPQFIKSALTELWLKHCVETKILFISLHILFTRLDQNTCDVLLKAQVLKGCDVTSKTRTNSFKI